MIIYISAFMLFAVIFAYANKPFTGVRLTLTTDKMLLINQKIVESVLREFYNTPRDSLVLSEKSVYLIFNTTTDNIKVEKPVVDFTNKVQEYKNGVFTVNYTKPFYIKYHFSTSVTVQGIHATYGKGSAIIIGNLLALTQNYNTKVPQNNVTTNISVDSVTFNEGIYSEATVGLIRRQFQTLCEVLHENFVNYTRDFDTLRNVEEFVQELNTDKKSINISRYKVESIHGTDSQTRFINSEIVMNGVKTKQELPCNYHQPKEGISEMCFCSHLFPQALVMGDTEIKLDPNDWGLKGKVIELYEIIPVLVNFYPPHENYRITTRAVKVNPFGNKSLLTRTYEFIIREASVLGVNTTFALTLDGMEENEQFFVKQINAEIDSVNTTIMINPSGLTVLARLMIYEVNKMVEKKMFEKGIKIHKIDNKMSMSNTMNSFCILL